MAETKIDINLEAAQAAVENLKVANDKLNLAKEDMGTNPFSPLCSVDPDLASHYTDEYLESITDVYNFSLKNVYGALNDIVTKLKDQENKTEGENTGKSTGGGSGSGGGSSSGGGGTGGSGESTGGSNSENGDTQDYKQIVVGSLSEASIKEIDGMVNDLKTMSDKANKGIDELLLDEKLADQLKAMLLASQNIPSDLKEKLKDADSKIIREIFASIMNGEEPEVFDLNPLNIGVVYNYLMSIANENGITVEELLTNEEYSELLKTTLASFEDIVDVTKEWDSLSAKEYQEKLLQIYDGNEIGGIKTNVVNTIRTFIDYVSESTEISSESLLTEEKYAEIMKRATQEFGKTAAFLKGTSHYSEKGMRDVVSGLFMGKNAAALGMNENNVNGFKSEIDSLAKTNGVTATELLTDSKYSDTVKEALNNSKNAEDVGMIYSKAESSVSQKIANNLYNTKFEKNTDKTGDVPKNA